MATLITQPTTTALWQGLVKEAQADNHLFVNEELESYLVFLLTRFTSKPEIANSILAFDYLHGMEMVGRQQMNELRDVGDKCLLFAGLFAPRAAAKNVRISYFVDLGQGAYLTLASLSRHKIAELYTSVGESFVPLMDILQSVNHIASDLQPLEAAELCSDTGSKHAITALRRYTQSVLITPTINKIKH